MRTTAANGLPMRLRKPVSGPMRRSVMSVATSSGREWSPEEVATLIAERKIGPLTGFRSRMGKPFAAVVRLTDDFRTEFDFGQDREDEAPPDFSSQESLGDCPKCGH